MRKSIEEHGIAVDVYRSPEDDTLIVHVETPGIDENEKGPLIRVYLNDEPVFENPPYPSQPIEPVLPSERCGQCANCRKLDRTRTTCLTAITRAQMKGESVGEDARLVWNRALEDFPCLDPRNP